MKRIACAALGLLVLCACGKAPEPELLEPVTIDSDIARVTVGSVCSGTVLEGNILPELKELSFSADGRVGEICVVLGDRVKAGDPLVRLDAPQLEDRREALEEQLEYARTMDAFETRGAELNTELLAQQFGWSSARCRLYANEQAEAAQSRKEEIARLEEQLAEVADDLEVQGVLTAPCSGTVAAILVNVGDMVREDDTVAVVANDSACRLQTEFVAESVVEDAEAVYAMVGGSRYEVTYIPMETEEYIARSLAGDKLYARFALKNGKSELIGQCALLYLMSAQREQVLNIPAGAVLRDGTSFYVYVDQHGEKCRRDVKIGLKTDAQAEILSGLQEGECVYVVG